MIITRADVIAQLEHCASLHKALVRHPHDRDLRQRYRNAVAAARRNQRALARQLTIDNEPLIYALCLMAREAEREACADIARAQATGTQAEREVALNIEKLIRAR